MYICSFINESFIEYEGELSLVIFTDGCNLDCYGCYNKDKLGLRKISFKECLRENMTPLHTAVVFLGGEPTCNPYLLDMISYVKEHYPELKIKIYTNGLAPDIIKKIIPYINACSVDFKTWDNENNLLGIPLSGQDYRNSVLSTIGELRKGNVQTEVRTIRNPKLEEGSIEKIQEYMKKVFPTVKHIVAPFICPQ